MGRPVAQLFFAASALVVSLQQAASGHEFQVQTSALRVRDPPSIRGSYESAVGDVRAPCDGLRARPAPPACQLTF